jgi:hypothetical protein
MLDVQCWSFLLLCFATLYQNVRLTLFHEAELFMLKLRLVVCAVILVIDKNRMRLLLRLPSSVSLVRESRAFLCYRHLLGHDAES